MGPAIDPGELSVRIDDRGARELRAVAHLRGAPVLRESGSRVLFSTRLQRRIGKELEEIVILETHRAVRGLRFVTDAERGRFLTAAEFLRFFLRSDRYESDGKATACRVIVGLAQLRERLLEKRSTDVSEPDHERRERNPERDDLLRNRVADVWRCLRFHRGDPFVGKEFDAL